MGDKKTTTGNNEPESTNESSPQPATPAVYKYLDETHICLRESWHKKPSWKVPPPTPKSIYDFERAFPPIPEDFPDLKDLQLPVVRRDGVKRSIEILAEYFGCSNYEENLLQFWFLDIITDCIWKAQDEFRFPDESQKVMLGWVLYVIELIRGSDKNFSRKKLFSVFKEAILVAGELVDEGHLEVPMPKDLVQLVTEEEEEESVSGSSETTTTSSISVLSSEADGVSYVGIGLDGEEPDVYQLPKQPCNCDKHELSSVETLSETTLPASSVDMKDTATKVEENVEQKNSDKETDELEEELWDVEFYQPDLSVPSRFLSLPEKPVEIVAPSNTPCLETRKEEEGIHDLSEASDSYELVSNSQLLTESVLSCPTSLFSLDQHSSIEPTSKSSYTQSLTTEARPDTAESRKIFKVLRKQKLMEQKLAAMNDPDIGWLPYDNDTGQKVDAKPDSLSDDSEWFDVIVEGRQETRDLEDQTAYNFGVLWAVIDFVFNYFYESFQFTLIKLAFQACPGIVTQKVNDAWKVPKLVKDELKKPVKKKEKKKKKDKKKKKKGKSKSKKSKKSKKSSKKSSKKGSKKGKKDKKKKKEKKKKLTKEEKAELERQRREQELIEEELRKMEENRRFMFPLADATDDELFKSLFENWVKVEIKSDKKDKKKKGKGKTKKKK